MEQTLAQLAQYERDGFLIFPDLFTPAEIAVLRQEVVRLAKLDAEAVSREHTGGVKSIFRVHLPPMPVRKTRTAQHMDEATAQRLRVRATGCRI
jgi:ectoine hydroxylase